jgi:hypothetical protein
MDATQWFFHSFLSFNYQVFIRRNHQNGRQWVASNVVIAQPVLLRSCKPILPLLASPSAHLCSALAAAYPDDVDERFAVHWYSRPLCVLAFPLVTSS